MTAGKPEEQERQEIADKEMQDRREPSQAERERARRIVDSCDADWSDAAENIARALAEVRAEERAYCVEFCENYTSGPMVDLIKGAQACAAAIRRGGA